MTTALRPRLLCATHVVPVPARAGNAYRIQRLLSWLTSIGWDVRLVVSAAVPPTDEQHAALTRLPFPVEVCAHHDDPDSEPGDHTPDDARVEQLVRGLCPSSLVERVATVAAEWNPQVVLVEYAFLTRAFPRRAPGAAHPLFVVDTIDVFSTKAAKVEAHGVRDEYSLTAAQEAQLLSPADLIVAIQAEEAAALAGLAPGTPVVTAGIDVAVAPGTDGPSMSAPSPPRTVLLVASANPMNVAGLQGFVDEAWPLVRAAAPEAVLRVVGPVGASLAGDPPAGVQIVGSVEAVADEYARAHVVVNPAAAGTGLKVKTVEAVAHARTVVCWPAGVDGMPPVLRRRCVVVDDWAAFADAVVAALQTPVRPVTAEEESALSAVVVYGTLRRTLDAMVAHREPRSRRAPRSARPRVLSLLAQHGAAAYPTARQDLHALLTRRVPHADHRLVVVDNSPAPPWERFVPRSRRHVVRGSNAGWEFSAWDDGIAHLGSEFDEFDAVALVTSAFLRFDAMTHLDLLTPEHVERVRVERIALGHIDRFDEPVWFDGVAMQSWLRSSFVLLAPEEVRRLGSLVSVPAEVAATVFTDDPAAPFADDAQLSDNYQRYLRGWLTGDGTGQGVQWHSRFDLDAATLPWFRAKATAILNEQLLTHRLRVQSCHPTPLP